MVADPQLLRLALEVIPVKAEKAGLVVSIGCRAVGQAAMLLGAGRETQDSVIDPAVGLVLHKKVGDLVIAGEPYVTLHVNDRGRLPEVLALLKEAIRFGPEAPARTRLIHHVIS